MGTADYIDPAREMPAALRGGRAGTRRRRSGWLFPVAVPAVLLLLATGVFWLWPLDLAAMRPFFDERTGFWAGQGTDWIRALYEVGPVPGIALGTAGLMLAVAGWAVQRWRRFFRPGLFLLAFALLIPGVFVNFVLKDHTGRARPRDVATFDGPYAYQPPLSLGPKEQGRSFPSGHAAIAFYVMAPWFLLRWRRPRCAWACLIAGLVFGALIGYVRMAEGGHYPSDILWSAAIVYFGGLVLARFVLGRGEAVSLLAPASVTGPLGAPALSPAPANLLATPETGPTADSLPVAAAAAAGGFHGRFPPGKNPGPAPARPRRLTGSLNLR